MLSKNEAYICLSAMLRAREPKLLNADRASRMIDAPSFTEAAKMLSELGYEDLSCRNAGEIGEALNRRRERIFAEIDRLAPENVVTDLFRMKYDCHNAKVLIKAEAMGVPAERLMSGSGRIAPDRMKALYTEERYAQLPGKTGEAMREAKDVLARTSNPQLADFIIDRAYFAGMSETAAGSGNAFLQDYVRLLADTANLKSTVRSLRMGKPADFLREALVPGGKVAREKLTSVSNGETLRSPFSGTPLEKAAALGAEAMSRAVPGAGVRSGKTGETGAKPVSDAGAGVAADASSGGNLTAFERECDNAANTFLKKAKMVSFGSEPVTAYLAAVENEITAVRMILTGRLSGIRPEALRERLRELYV